MLVTKAVQLILAAAMMWRTGTDAAATSAVRLCGRKLSEIMSRVCHAYNSPTWYDPTVEQPATAVRRKRQVGIADECCTYGCTWEQLNEYCAISAISESPLDSLEAHMIADRSAEREGASTEPSTPVVVGSAAKSALGKRREVGRGRRGGYGRRRCRCRRRRRSGRRRAIHQEANKKCRARCARSRYRVTAADHVGKDSQYRLATN